MIFEDKEHCLKYYFNMLMFFFLGFCLLGASFYSNEIKFSDLSFYLVSGINFSITGLGSFIILIYYTATRSRVESRQFNIEIINVIWIIVNFFIASFFFITLAPIWEIIIIGYYIFSVITVVILVCIGQWLYDHNYRNRKKMDEIIGLINRVKHVIKENEN
ncbi:MAG: hypothetical protein ACFFD7_15455 [Candidatus Thorarchaeota archaeon]